MFPLRDSRQPDNSSWLSFIVALAASVLLLLNQSAFAQTDADGSSVPEGDALGEEFFEQHIRPLLWERCGACHVEEAAGGLSLLSREKLLQGGDSGASAVPGDLENSLLLQAVRRTADNPMPPEKPLNDHEIKLLEQWVAANLPWSAPLAPTTELSQESHWAFQPVQNFSPPQIADDHWSQTAIDPFILKALREAGLEPAAPASESQWLRRVYVSLTGLPPSATEVAQYQADTAPDKEARVVDALLKSPRYGQHLARLWLDLARYSDTKGYVYAREERFWVHAWNYRDWVINAFNEDLPYDRFLLLQLAADQVSDRRDEDMAAMGFLTIGRRFLGVKHDIIDDRIDVVCRGTMGLTVGCARCHNHKYDPIPTTDYYSLYGVFDSSSEQLVALPAAQSAVAQPDHPVTKMEQQLQSTLQQRRQEQAALVRTRFADYLWAQTELHKYPADGFDQIFAKEDLLPAFVRRFQRYLLRAEPSDAKLFIPWHLYRQIPKDHFAAQSPIVTQGLLGGEHGEVNALVLEQFREAPQSLREVADRYGSLMQQVAAKMLELAPECAAGGEVVPASLGDDLRPFWFVLFDDQGPCQVPNRGIVHTESFFDSGTVNELWKLQGDLDRAIIQAGKQAPFALALRDNAQPENSRVFRRGNPLDQGDEVPRRFLTALSGEADTTFQQGSGRLELAQAIIDPRNPLTARVIVNRIWAHHFGRGLVPTTSDFGRRANPPSHPELLDYLAHEFVANGWSLKWLHRLLVLSATFRQNSLGPADATQLALANEQDPENRLLWRMNTHRLSFEELRDSLLLACETLDDSLQGPAAPLLQEPFPTRRTVYGLIDRQFLPASFRVFDFASPDLHIPQRNETTIPQQALFLMNHPLVLHHASALADRLVTTASREEQVQSLFLQVLKRPPTSLEMQESLEFLDGDLGVESIEKLPTVDDWHYGYGRYDETSQRLASFTSLPHFTGDAWQGGASFPDGTLGWVQLSAAGGHPGNDRDHASVRRWIAPRAMRVIIRSTLQHDPEPGDGIRAFIVSSRAGTLALATVHRQKIAMDTESIVVEAGETLDFIVDIGEVLNSDQYLWGVTIVEEEADEKTISWDSQRDFTPNVSQRLTPLAQLAQVLFCSNEFIFVD